jgi:hypothetical protein
MTAYEPGGREFDNPAASPGWTLPRSGGAP